MYSFVLEHDAYSCMWICIHACIHASARYINKHILYYCTYVYTWMHAWIHRRPGMHLKALGSTPSSRSLRALQLLDPYFYACMHVSVYVVSDVRAMYVSVHKYPYIIPLLVPRTTYVRVFRARASGMCHACVYFSTYSCVWGYFLVSSARLISRKCIFWTCTTAPLDCSRCVTSNRICIM
jgi:hypothetical protein